MKTNNILEEIEITLQQRPDFSEAERCGSGDDLHLIAALQDEKHTTRYVVVHPLAAEDGPVLRVCLLNAAQAPSVIQIENLCARLNKEMWFGHFIEAPDGWIAHISHQMLISPCPEATILNRLLDDAMAASVFCRRIIQKIMQTALTNALAENETPSANLSLN
jgi:hypothetical protein